MTTHTMSTFVILFLFWIFSDELLIRHHPLIKASKWISRGFDLSTSLRTIFEVGMALEELVVLEETDECSEPALTLIAKIAIVHGL